MRKTTRPSTKLHHNPQPLPDWSAFGLHLTRYNIDEVLHYTHWIPNQRGHTAAFFQDRYPGWSLAAFLEVFRAAGIQLDDGRGAPHGGRCHWQLKCLHFDSIDSFAVEWDESILADDGRYYYSGRADSIGNGAFTVAVEPEDVDDPEKAGALAERLIVELGIVPFEG